MQTTYLSVVSVGDKTLAVSKNHSPLGLLCWGACVLHSQVTPSSIPPVVPKLQYSAAA